MKLAALTVGAWVGLALACGPARAQAVAPDDAPPPSPPPQYVPPPPPGSDVAPQQNSAQPPPQYYPAAQQYYPPPPGYQLVPALTPEQINEMEAQGRRRKVAGGILLGFGIAAAVVAQALLIAYYAKGATITCVGSTCVTDDGKSFLYGSIALDVVAPVLLGVGIPLLSNGAAQVRRARNLRNGNFVPVSLAPSINSHGAELRLAFAF